MVSRPDWPGPLHVEAMTDALANEIAGWTYPHNWSVYNLSPETALFTPEAGYFAVLGSHETLVGFACSGVEARVPGLIARADALDIGWGMNPTFVGGGHGTEFGTVILRHFQKTSTTTVFRVVVQSWNDRGLRLAKSLGFEEIGTHESHQSGAPINYRILHRALEVALTP